MPVCTRCHDRGISCIYTQSRRGYKGPRKATVPTTTTARATAQATHPTKAWSTTPAIANVSNQGESALSGSIIPQVERESVLQVFSTWPHPADWPISAETSSRSMTDSGRSQTDSTTASTPPDLAIAGLKHRASAKINDRLVDAFYNCFYPAYPFVVPSYYYNHSGLPDHLRDVMRFVGSHFVSGFSPELLRPLATSILSAHDISEDGHKVQSLFLLAMALFARFEIEQAVEAFNGAIDLALMLGMNRKEFSSLAGQATAEESWRRTWWDLYVVDGLVSAVDSLGWTSKLRDMPTDVPLPCEEHMYDLKDDPNCSRQRSQLPTKTLVDMENRIFDDFDYPWSSFAYEVESMRLMHNVLRATTDLPPPSDAEIEALDASLSGFVLSLPVHKRELSEKDGKVDEKMFAALMVVHWSTILVHRPRSHLTSLGERYATSCSLGESIDPPVFAYATHTAKALRAADEISKMISLRVPITIHTPCLTCAIAKAALVHLPAFILEPSPRVANTLKERLRLAISGLTTMGEIWPMAVMVKQQLSQYAREAFTAPRAMACGPIPDTRLQQMEQIDIAAFSDDTWVDLLGNFDPSSAIPLS